MKNFWILFEATNEEYVMHGPAGRTYFSSKSLEAVQAWCEKFNVDSTCSLAIIRERSASDQGIPVTESGSVGD
jgi:hypothetical protein